MTSPTGRKRNGRSEEWRERIAKQKRSGKTIAQFCKEQGLTEQSFYGWRKRLGKAEPVSFALVDTSAMRQPATTEPVLELVLATGERLRICAGVDTTELRRVVAALRA